MKSYKIYQTETRGYVFMPFDYAMEKGFSGKDYSLVYEGIIEAETINEALEKLFIIHNRDDRPNGKGMRSLSVSDVVTLDGIPYYCDRWGWSEIPTDRWDMK